MPCKDSMLSFFFPNYQILHVHIYKNISYPCRRARADPKIDTPPTIYTMSTPESRSARLHSLHVCTQHVSSSNTIRYELPRSLGLHLTHTTMILVVVVVVVYNSDVGEAIR